MNIDPIGAFLSVAIIAWATQRITYYWDSRKKIDDTKLSIYMSWMPYLSEIYATTRFPDDPGITARDFLKKKLEILGILQLMGPSDAMGAFVAFCDDAEKAFQKAPDFDPVVFHQRFTDLNYQLCCEIHGEKPNSRQKYESEGSGINS